MRIEAPYTDDNFAKTFNISYMYKLYKKACHAA